MGLKGFVEGGVASIVAGCSTHPLDLIKVRMQTQGETLISTTAAVNLPSRAGPFSVGLNIFRTDGPAVLFSGVSATVLRQTLYSTTRMGLYDILKTRWSTPDSPLPLHLKISAGLLAGGIGVAVGNPADVAMVRMQADGRLPPHLRRNYLNAGDAMKTMVRSEGLLSLWKGSSLTVNRAMIVTASQLATYDQVKEKVVGRMGDGMGTHVVASLTAGVVAAAAANPVDVIKTRVMNMRAPGKGEMPVYGGSLDCLVKTVRTEGVMSVYKGFVPTVCRQGPFTVVLFVTLEQVRGLLKDFEF